MQQAVAAVMLLPNWPPNSPDLSPIENAWAWMEAEMDSRGCKTFENYQETLLELWEKPPPPRCEGPHEEHP